MSKKVFSPLGSSQHSKEARARNDYYASPPRAVRDLCSKVTFKGSIWEPACGEGHISKALILKGYEVHSTDLIDRGYGKVKDFFLVRKSLGDNIITNPPYNRALEFAQHAMHILPKGGRLALLLKVLFLEGKERGQWFREYPPSRIYVYSKRIVCAKNGKFDEIRGAAVAYAWFIWKKGVKRAPRIYWI